MHVCRNPSFPSPSPVPRPEVVCERCGVYGAYVWEGAALCLQCTIEQGSCCPEFEGTSREPAPDAPEATFDRP